MTVSSWSSGLTARIRCRIRQWTFKKERARIMLEAKIIERGRGPEIAGTRITVYDILDYYESGWHRDLIADQFNLSSRQVEVAIRYIEDHRDEVMAAYQKIMERI